jgi:phage terminase large subunit
MQSYAFQSLMAKLNHYAPNEALPASFDPKQFTGVFRELKDRRERFLVNYGGTGSSKSFSAAQNEVLKTITYAGIKTLVIRKVGTTLRDSVIPSFRSRISELGLDTQFKYHKTDRVLKCNNGSEIIFRGLDDPDKLKSFEGLQRILVEEAAELTFEDFLELNRRARGRENIQITLCFNPIHEEHWLKKHFIDNKLPDCHLIKSTYHDNRFLTDKDKEQIEALRLFNNNQYRVYALGEWGIVENNHPWLFAFDRSRHVKEDITFLPSFPVYLSFDFNRDPVTCLAVQQSPHRGARDSFIHFIKEFSAQEQLHDLCARIKAAFPASILYVTGDAMGAQGNVGFEQRHSSFYSMIQSYLGINNKLMNINSHNMQHHDSRNLLNMLLSQYPNILISQTGCPMLINECTIATVDENTSKPGILKKDRDVYKMDLFDCFRYFFQTYFKDFVTRVGLKRPL